MMPLDETDRAHLIHLGRACKTSGYPLSELLPYFWVINPLFLPTVRSICMKNNSRIHQEEVELMQWSQTFIFRVGPPELREIEQMLREGWHQE